MIILQCMLKLNTIKYSRDSTFEGRDILNGIKSPLLPSKLRSLHGTVLPVKLAASSHVLMRFPHRGLQMSKCNKCRLNEQFLEIISFILHKYADF